MEVYLKAVVIAVISLFALKALHQWLVEPLLESLKAIQNLLRHISEQLDQILHKSQEVLHDRRGRVREPRYARSIPTVCVKRVCRWRSILRVRSRVRGASPSDYTLTTRSRTRSGRTRESCRRAMKRCCKNRKSLPRR